jgi:hypothetical protein
MKTYFFGPTSTAKVISKSIANTYLQTTSPNDIISLTVLSGNGNYRLGETVFVGDNLQAASATAEVLSWNTTTNILKVTNTSGAFSSNGSVRGTVSGTLRSINNVGPVDSQLVYISVEPNPTTASSTDDFGYTEEIYETPNIPK